MSEHPKLVTSEDFAKALEAAGLIGSLTHIQEIVIRARAGQLVTIETTQVGDDRLYGLVPTLSGAKPHDCCKWAGNLHTASAACACDCHSPRPTDGILSQPDPMTADYTDKAALYPQAHKQQQ
jgi:hypothetical protein